VHTYKQTHKHIQAGQRVISMLTREIILWVVLALATPGAGGASEELVFPGAIAKVEQVCKKMRRNLCCKFFSWSEVLF